MAKKSAAGKKLVIVESPTKAKTIRKFLGNEFVVESCFGHVRDLPQSAKDIPAKFKKESWAALGVNVDKHFEPLYCVPKNKEKIVKELRSKLQDASELYLATDEDREGESISWHLVEVLKPEVPIKRMVFHEITQAAIVKSLKQVREIDFNLVKAQEARRVLDRLVGYTISPLIWKKIAYGLSAGRVQSVAVKLISDKELERVKFVKSQYSSVTAELKKEDIEFEAKLLQYKNQKIAIGKDFDGTTGKVIGSVLVLDPAHAQKIAAELKSLNLTVSEIEEKPVFRKPAAPFITSTLQQEASRKLGMSSRETMQNAQKLYEQGFITYMRTDSTNLSTEAISAARGCIADLYGKEYLPEAPRIYSGKKVKGAQEAHEAIRPAGSEFVKPDESGLTGVHLKLYDLIWKRTVASQMVDSRQKQVNVRFTAGDALLSSSGMTIEFPGFLRAYVEGSDDPDAELNERESRLPNLKKSDSLKPQTARTDNHETKPPARYTEASLVQTLEKEGIGRPSTYASIIGTIIDRGYVRKQGTTLIPTFTALIVSKLISKNFPELVDLGFTSSMENSLDNIAEGDLDWEKYLSGVYLGPKGLRKQVEIQEKLIEPEEAREIKLAGLEKFSFRVGRFGAYVCRTEKNQEFCASIPESESPADITADVANKLIDQKINGADSIGKDPKTGLPVYILTGRFGPYVQLGDIDGDESKPKRVSLPQGMTPEQVTFESALELLSLPKTLGTHPGLGKDIKAGLGRFGPYVVCEGDYRSIPKTMNLFTVTLADALDLFSKPKAGRGRAAPLKDLGPHPDNKDEVIQVMNGKYGPYVKCGKVNATIPEGIDPQQITLEKAIELIQEKGGVSKSDKSSSQKKSAAVKKVSVKNDTAKTELVKKNLAKKQTPKKTPALKKPDLNVKRIVKAKAKKTNVRKK